ncbi:MAG: YdcF family protein [Scytolyngbya sp. HA4215-MV1]|jgi:uncharacterized SAM-binding protein YcdF (DUF218 family)|nr:YdcF family protein [Scytolyngbya sp. HA4215-MV1]
MGILWLISSRRWRRRVIIPATGFLLTYLIATSAWGLSLLTQGMLIFLPKDSGEAVDTIAVLGRGETLQHRRIELAEQLWRAKRAPKIFISGMTDAPYMIEQLKDLGIPAQVLGGERCSESTKENVQLTSGILYPQGIQKILLITDPPHMLRSVLLFQSYGFKVVPHLSPLPPQFNPREHLLLILREYAALVQYAMTGQFKQRTVAELRQPSAEVIEKIHGCKI